MSGARRAAAGAVVEDLAPGLERLFAFVPEERSYTVREVRGRLPEWLAGTCYWNGPGRFERGAQRYRHWLDGDGMVTALRFAGGGRVHLTNRFVRGTKWSAEETAGRALFRTFGTTFAGDRLVRGMALESPINVSVVPYGGSLFACGEQGLPWELDPVSLETRGAFTFGGALNPVSPFAAHAKVDAASGELHNFGLSYALDRPALHLYRFDPAGGQAAARRRVPLERPVSMHDFCLAPRHAVFHVGPYHLDLHAVVTGGRSVLEALRWEPEIGSELLIVPLAARLGPADAATAGGVDAAGTDVVRVPMGRGYCLHGIGAGEDASGRLVVDLLELDHPVYDQYQDLPDLFQTVGPGRPVRVVVDLERRMVVERREIAYDRAPDFPVTAPRLGTRAPDDAWMLGMSAAGRPGRKFFDELVHIDWRRSPGSSPAVWRAPRGHYLTGEPALALDPSHRPAAVSTSAGSGGSGNAGGTAGSGGTGSPPPAVLVCPLFDATRGESRYLVFDALDVESGPRAEVVLEAPLPTAFHAAFAPPPP